MGAPRLTSGSGWLLALSHLCCRKQFVSVRLTGAPFFSTYSLLRNKRGIRSHEKQGRLQVSLVRSLPSWHELAICTNDTSLGGKKRKEKRRRRRRRKTHPSFQFVPHQLVPAPLLLTFNLICDTQGLFSISPVPAAVTTEQPFPGEDGDKWGYLTDGLSIQQWFIWPAVVYLPNSGLLPDNSLSGCWWFIWSMMNSALH